VDVFGSTPFSGNPVATVLDGAGLTTADMQRFAHWTNLSETTYVLPPDEPGADYQVRIFTTAWPEAGGRPADPDVIVQQCKAGLVQLRRQEGLLSFAAPPPLRAGEVEESLIADIATQLGIARSEIVAAQWADNGPGWVAVLLDSAQDVLDLRPNVAPGMDLGVAGFYPAGSECAIEVRAFFTQADKTAEDPVTGSLNASLAQWLVAAERIAAPYVASQGTAVGRRGRVHVSADSEGTIWIAGATATKIVGTVEL